MIARRDVLRLAAAAGLARSLPVTISPAEAARLLAGPAVEPLPEPPADTPEWQDPAAFADLARSELYWDLPELAAPEGYRAYQAARAACERAYGFDHAHGITPFSEMDEAMHAWALGAYVDGVRHGAAYEALRRALVGGEL